MSSLLRVVLDPDTTPPGVPTLGTPTVVDQTRIDISWNAVTDTGGSGLAGYNILIDGTTLISTGVQTTYSATGFSASTTHTFRVQSRDGNGNTSNYSNQVSATTAAAPAPFNPTYPRRGAALIGGQRNYQDATVKAAVAKCHVVLLSEFPGWRLSRGTTMSAVCSEIRAASTVGTKIFQYIIPSEIAKTNANVGNAFWELYQYLSTNKLFAYSNGLAETGPMDADAGTSIAKINYTLGSKTVGGKQTAEYILDFYTGFLRDGVTVSNGSTSLTTVPNSNFDGLFIDNWFHEERTNADYNRDGAPDGISAGRASIRASYVDLAGKYRTKWPNAPLMVNSADWAQSDPFFGGPGAISGTAYNQLAEGGAIESAQDYEALSFQSMMIDISTQMNAYKTPKLGILFWQLASLTDYQKFRYGLGISMLTDTYYFPHVDDGYLSEEIPSIVFDEFNFNFGTASEAVQTSARYQAGTLGEGVWRRDFQNGIVIVGARRAPGSANPAAPYGAINLGATFYRLTGTQAPSVNNGAAVTSVTPVPGDTIFLSRTPTGATVTPIFDDDFSTASVGAVITNRVPRVAVGAAKWTETSGPVTVVQLSDGSKALQFLYPAGNHVAEQRWQIDTTGANQYRELWAEVTVDVSPGWQYSFNSNNKFFFFYNDFTGNTSFLDFEQWDCRSEGGNFDGSCIEAQMKRNGVNVAGGFFGGDNGNSHGELYPFIHEVVDAGKTLTFRVHWRMDTAASYAAGTPASQRGVAELMKDRRDGNGFTTIWHRASETGTGATTGSPLARMNSFNTGTNSNGFSNNHISGGYIFGTHNAAYPVDTYYRVRRFTIWAQNPGWGT